MTFSNANLPSSIGVVFGFLILLLLPFDNLLGVFDIGAFQQEFLGDTIKNLVIVIYGFTFIKYHGYVKISGVFKVIPRHRWLLIIPLYFLLFGPLEYYLLGYEFHDIQVLEVLILLLATFSVGLSEEIMFRGFVLPHLINGADSKESLIGPIVIAASLFGVLHFLNLLGSDASFALTLSQVVYATMFGVAFGIILLRTGSLLPLAIVHGLINFSSSLDELSGVVEPIDPDKYQMHEAILSVIVVLPFLLYAVKQLRKVDKEVSYGLTKSASTTS